MSSGFGEISKSWSANWKLPRTDTHFATIIDMGKIVDVPSSIPKNQPFKWNYDADLFVALD